MIFLQQKTCADGSMINSYINDHHALPSILSITASNMLWQYRHLLETVTVFK